MEGQRSVSRPFPRGNKGINARLQSISLLMAGGGDFFVCARCENENGKYLGSTREKLKCLRVETVGGGVGKFTLSAEKSVWKWKQIVFA